MTIIGLFIQVANRASRYPGRAVHRPESALYYYLAGKLTLCELRASPRLCVYRNAVPDLRPFPTDVLKRRNNKRREGAEHRGARRGFDAKSIFPAELVIARYVTPTYKELSVRCTNLVFPRVGERGLDDSDQVSSIEGFI